MASMRMSSAILILLPLILNISRTGAYIPRTQYQIDASRLQDFVDAEEQNQLPLPLLRAIESNLNKADTDSITLPRVQFYKILTEIVKTLAKTSVMSEQTRPASKRDTNGRRLMRISKKAVWEPSKVPYFIPIRI